MSTYYDEYRNVYYNPDDVEENPGDNQNWKMIQRGFDAVEADITDEVYSTTIGNFTIAAGGYKTIEVPISGRLRQGLAKHTGWKVDVSLFTLVNAANIEIGKAYTECTSGNEVLYTIGRIEGRYATNDTLKLYFDIHNRSDSDIVVPSNYIRYYVAYSLNIR